MTKLRLPLVAVFAALAVVAQVAHVVLAEDSLVVLVLFLSLAGVVSWLFARHRGAGQGGGNGDDRPARTSPLVVPSLVVVIVLGSFWMLYIGMTLLPAPR